jgi:hypothetical protein
VRQADAEGQATMQKSVCTLVVVRWQEHLDFLGRKMADESSLCAWRWSLAALALVATVFRGPQCTGLRKCLEVVPVERAKWVEAVKECVLHKRCRREEQRD